MGRVPDLIAPEHPRGGCNPQVTTSMVTALVSDPDDPPRSLSVEFRYELSTDSSVVGTVGMSSDGNGAFSAVLGPFVFGAVPEDGGIFTIRVSATDPDGGLATADPVTVVLNGCGPEG